MNYHLKKFILIFTLLFSTVISSSPSYAEGFLSPSYAEWTKVNKDADGNTNYVDFESIRKKDEYVYWWVLSDILKPTIQGHSSSKTYNQGDCKLFRLKILSFSFHKEPMGEGTGNVSEPVEKYKGWIYPPPGSSFETTLKRVCEYAN